MQSEELRRYERMYDQLEHLLGTSLLRFEHSPPTAAIYTDHSRLRLEEERLTAGFQRNRDPVSPL